MISKIILLSLFLSTEIFCQSVEQKDSISIVFMGDIMGHNSQINSAFSSEARRYNYEDVFSNVSHIIEVADFAIANLEVTLAGKPYRGYPRFSSPDELAVACKNMGIDVLVTANNHSCDRGAEGVLRTIDVLDSLGIRHTGTFKNSADRAKNNLLILSKNNIRIGLLNYTYGTNGLPPPSKTIINRIDLSTIVSDIKKSKEAFLDKLIIMIHWGNEYQSQPSKNQIEIAEFLFRNGVDIIIGSHPHVLQRMEYIQKTKKSDEHLIAYSLGNFLSNQRRRRTDGGAILRLTLTKKNKDTNISHCGYYLTWVHKIIVDNKRKFEIIPCSIFEAHEFYDMDYSSKERMKLFTKDSRTLLEKENIAVKEITTNTDKK